MKKTTKGAIAAGGAAVLLMGGAGTLAFWTATGSASLGTISSGHLTISAGTCGAWTLDAAGGGGTFAPATSKLVPGDSITRTCTYTVTAAGDHLKATVGLVGGTGVVITGGNPSATGANLTAGAVFKIYGNVVANNDLVDMSTGDTTVTADITVNFPYGANDTANGENGNGTQDLSAALDTIAVTLTQQHA
jgi:alternate signal-mediated exported protein